MKLLLIGILLAVTSSAFAVDNSYIPAQEAVKDCDEDFRNVKTVLDGIQNILLKEENHEVITDKFTTRWRGDEIKRIVVTQKVSTDPEDILQSEAWVLIIDTKTCNTYYKLL